MKANHLNSQLLPRRNVLKQLATAAAVGLSTMTSAEEPRNQKFQAAALPLEVANLVNLQDTKTLRSSSYDRTGGNGDNIPIEVGQTATILQVDVPGVVTHIWCTINSDDPLHLKNLVLRAYWDGEKEPSVEVPIGDFFGLGLGEYFLYESALLAVAPMRALNAYFPMPFGKTALMTVTNEGTLPTNYLYYNIDYFTAPSLPTEIGYFHAQYRQATPTKGWTDAWASNFTPLVGGAKNLTGKGNYVFLEAHGRGHLIGVTQAILQNQDGWMGEGDDMIFIDDDTLPTINGTGLEDYYNGAWGFAQPYSYRYIGAPYILNPERVGGRYCLYRWHIDNPIRFQRSLKMTIEHGHANHRSDNYFSTAYWYQSEPHAAFPVLPSATERAPRVFAVGGPGAVPLPSSKR